jgi:MoxR-like ATPase
MKTLSEHQAKQYQQLSEKIIYELKKVIVGQDRLLERLLVASIAQGHVLVEGAPGLAKTLTLKSLARVLDVQFSRIQFTPDLLPADLIGTRIYNPAKGEFTTELGPILANLVLADEINRAPAKVQSALLQAMEEMQITIGRHTYNIKRPFLVMATQNPIEQEGTYPLPEAQMDRFLFKLLVSYPDPREELIILERMSQGPALTLEQVAGNDDLLCMCADSQRVFLDPALSGYIVDIVQATRQRADRRIQFGASPRGSLALARSARALAMLHGRNYVIAADVKELAKDCLRHRIILSYEAIAAGETPDALLDRILAELPCPAVLEEALAA